MKHLNRYRKKADQFVVAIKVDLDTDGFTYNKWGGVQQCKRGDWLLDNNGDIYTVDGEVFTRTYRRVSAGRYVKTTQVWAEVATDTGSIATKEGRSAYQAGDYLVYNNEDGTDAYCMNAAKFESMYEANDDTNAC
jgi:hypothetical protein